MSTHQSTRHVIITGGSSGIGRCTARLFAKRGWRVSLIARGAAPLEAARQALAQGGAQVAAFQADVADNAALQRAAEAAEQALGPADVWINNAGVSVFARFTEMTEAEFRRVTDVTYMGAVNGTRVALALMRPRNAGCIINVNSAIGLRGVPLQSAYSGAKWAMRGFAEAVRAELIHERSHIHLGSVFPPSVNTPFYLHAVAHLDGAAPRPPPPIYQPDIVAEAIYIAAIQRRREQLIGGMTLATSLVNEVAPALVDRLLGAFGPGLQRSSRQEIRDKADPNLFDAASNPAAERGPFDDESLSTSPQLWLSRNRGAVSAGLAIGAVLMGMRRPQARSRARRR